MNNGLGDQAQNVLKNMNYYFESKILTPFFTDPICCNSSVLISLIQTVSQPQ